MGFSFGRLWIEGKGKNKGLPFRKLLCAELEAVWNVVVTEWNTSGNGGFY
jgi:hypothetical protein